MLKEIYIDVETTGLDRQKSAIWSLSGAIFIEGVMMKEFDFYIAPHENAMISPKAIEMSNLTLDELAEFPSADVVFARFKKMLESYVKPFVKTDKFIFKAYNATFDSDFVRSFFLRNGSKFYGSYFHAPAYDVMVIALAALEDKREKLQDFKLSTVASFLGLDVDFTGLHRSAYDIELTRNVDLKARELLKGNFK